MKAPAFKYHDPTTLEEALDLLARYGDGAKVLAGGQSLMPLLNFRLARPRHLIDVNGIVALGEIKQMDGHLQLGAMVRQRNLERSPMIAEVCPTISEAMPFVGHAQIRNRGTLGGSLAHADPAAELPAVMLAVDARFALQKKGGQRVVDAQDFFLGELTTALQPDEMLVRIDVPVDAEETGSSIQEIAMRTGDFALAGLVTSVTLGPGGAISRARLVCFGVADRPMRVVEAEDCLVGRTPTDESLAEAARLVSERVHPVADIHASAEYRKRVAGILTRRALVASLESIKQVVR